VDADEVRGAAREGGEAESPPPRWLRELTEAALGLRELAQAQWHLFGAEWRLARSAAMTALVAALLVAVFALALGLTTMALAAWLLAQWLGSWAWALVVLGGVLLACLVASGYLFRRCLYWMSLPETRTQWRRMIRDFGREAAPARADDKGEDTHDDTSSTAG